MAWSLPSDLSSTQARLLLEESPPPGAKLRKYTVEAVLNAILYLIKTGGRWSMLPPHSPKITTDRHLAGKFRQDFIGLDARIVPSSTCEISSTIRRLSDAKI